MNPSEEIGDSAPFQFGGNSDSALFTVQDAALRAYAYGQIDTMGNRCRLSAGIAARSGLAACGNKKARPSVRGSGALTAEIPFIREEALSKSASRSAGVRTQLRAHSRLFFALGLLALPAGCDLSPGGRISGRYLLDIVDVTEDANVCYELDNGDCAERIPQTVFAVGSNADYIVAARHPHSVADRQLDRSRTSYYYIIRAADGPDRDPAASVRGPFDAGAFARERQRLGLPQFTRELAQLR